MGVGAGVGWAAWGLEDGVQARLLDWLVVGVCVCPPASLPAFMHSKHACSLDLFNKKEEGYRCCSVPRVVYRSDGTCLCHASKCTVSSTLHSHQPSCPCMPALQASPPQGLTPTAGCDWSFKQQHMYWRQHGGSPKDGSSSIRSGGVGSNNHISRVACCLR